MRTLVIGLGAMGRRHVAVATSLGLDLVGVCDTRPDAFALVDLPSNTERHTDGLQAIDLLSPECVIVATTAPSHASLTVAAADAGAAVVLCEKPIATSLNECDEMIDACRKSSTRLAINHQMRFMEQYQVVRSMIEDPTFGQWRSISVVAGNFGLAMNGVHYFELFRWLTGEEPSGVSAWLLADNVPNPRGAMFSDSSGTVRVTTPTGRRMTLECGADLGHGVHVVYAGRTGSAVADELAGTIDLSVRAAEHRELPTTRYGMPAQLSRAQVAPADVIQPTRAVLQALLDGANYPTGADGRLALATLMAAHESHERGGVTSSIADVDVTRRLPIA